MRCTADWTYKDAAAFWCAMRCEVGVQQQILCGLAVLVRLFDLMAGECFYSQQEVQYSLLTYANGGTTDTYQHQHRLNCLKCLLFLLRTAFTA